MNRIILRIFFVIAALIGLGIAILNMVFLDQVSLTADTVARVNGTLITKADYERAVAAVVADRRNPLTAADRQEILQRLIEEELLLQHGLYLGLVQTDRAIRSQIVATVMDMAVADINDRPSEEQLKDFYHKNTILFTVTGRVQIEQLYFTVDKSQQDKGYQHAKAIAEDLRQGKASSQLEIDSKPDAILLPKTLLPWNKLQEYIGPTHARLLKGMAKGTITDPIAIDGDYIVYKIIDKEEDYVPAYETVKDLVRVEFERQLKDQALRELLEQLKQTADIQKI